MSLYVFSILNKYALPPSFSYRGMLFIYAYTALTADNDYNVDMMRSPSCVQKNNFIIIIIISAAASVSELRGGCPAGWVSSTRDAIFSATYCYKVG